MKRKEKGLKVEDENEETYTSTKTRPTESTCEQPEFCV